MIPLFKPYMNNLPMLQKILSSGKLSYGKYGLEFEQSIARFLNVSNVITTNTFTMSIFVTLRTLGLSFGDSVIASPMACLASTQPLIAMGLNVIWADVDPRTGTLSPESVRNLVKLNPKAIIHNHYCGYVGFVDEINSIGLEFNIPVIDDCIEAFGSEYKGKKMGNVGSDITIFSFGPVRLPNTIDGGAIVFKNDELYRKSLIIRDSGIDRTNFRDDIGEINPICDINLIGYAATMDEVRSYMGLTQLEEMDTLLQKQRENARKWNEIDLDYYGLKPILTLDSIPNYWVYGTLGNKKRESIVALREQGMYASGVHIRNDLYSVFKNKAHLPGVEEFNNSFVALPCGWWVDNICL